MPASPPRQLRLLPAASLAHGGELFRTRAGRRGPRPLSTRHTLHLVLRSTQARGEWSFRTLRNQGRIRRLAERFARRYGIRIVGLANVGNHLHFQLKLSNRRLYAPFIRALTGAIALTVTGRSRWKPRGSDPLERRRPFWDYRPFTRIVVGRRGFLTLRDYLALNRWESRGFDRATARRIVREERARGQGAKASARGG
jgi:hypothetical protein